MTDSETFGLTGKVALVAGGGAAGDGIGTGEAEGFHGTSAVSEREVQDLQA